MSGYGSTRLCAFLLFLLSCLPALRAQTVIWVPGGTVGNISGSYVGVGTSSPLTAFHVASSSSNSTALTLQSTASGGGYYSVLTSNGSAGIGGGKFSIYDQIAGAHRLTIDSVGNVGIGTTSPSLKAEIANG